MSDPRKADLAHVVHPFTLLRTLPEEGPRIIERGEGVYVWDARDRADSEAVERAAAEAGART